MTAISLTYPTARDAICLTFDTHWQANAGGIISYIPEIRFPRVVYRDAVDKSKHYGIITIRNLMAEQAAFCAYGNSRKKYVERGIVIVEFFGPKDRVEVGAEIGTFAHIVRAAFRGKSEAGKVWFRKASIVDVDDEGEQFRVNVTAEYRFSEIG